MIMKKLMLAVALGVIVGLSHPVDAKHNTKDAAGKQSVNSASTMTPEMQAKMKEMEKLMAPGENHKILDQLAGQWNHKVRWWMTPESPVEENMGTNNNHWIFGKRFLQQDVHGKNAKTGQPFEGVGYVGYDNVKQQYTTMWIDNMATGMMTANATYDSATKTFAETGTFSCPMSGEKDKPFRSVMKIVDANHYTYEMYTKAADGKEFKNLEIAYERAGKQTKTISQR